MRLRVLVSYHYFRNVDMNDFVADFPEPPEIFADSGGFSAYSQGVRITVDEYADWLTKWSPLIETYANLDVIGNASATKANQTALEDRELTPIPVFHAGEPVDFLRDYVERYPYVALGGMVPISSDLALRWAAQCFKIGQTHETKFHGFGQTSVKIMRALPWYSIDSSTWISPNRNGRVGLWDDRRAKFVNVIMGDHDEVYRHAPLFRDHGVDPSVVATRKFGKLEGTEKTVDQRRAERTLIHTISLIAWLKMERWLRGHHGDPGQPKMYLVMIKQGNGAVINCDMNMVARYFETPEPVGGAL